MLCGSHERQRRVHERHGLCGLALQPQGLGELKTRARGGALRVTALGELEGLSRRSLRFDRPLEVGQHGGQPDEPISCDDVHSGAGASDTALLAICWLARTGLPWR